MARLNVVSVMLLLVGGLLSSYPGLEYMTLTAPVLGSSATTEPARPASACWAARCPLGSSVVCTSSPTGRGLSCPKIELSPVCTPRRSGPADSSSPAASPLAAIENPTGWANRLPVGYDRLQVLPAAGTDLASTVPSAARICPRLMCSSSSSVRTFNGLLLSEDAWNTVQREVNTTSSANRRMITPNSRAIGAFTRASGRDRRRAGATRPARGWRRSTTRRRR